MELRNEQQAMGKIEQALNGIRETPSCEGQIKQTPQITKQLESLEQNITYLNERISNMCDRISAIARIEVDSVCDETKDETLVPVAEFLKIQNERISSASHRIYELIQRIEL